MPNPHIQKNVVSEEGTITEEMVDALMNTTSTVNNFVTQPINAESIKEAVRLIQKEKRDAELDRRAWRFSYLYGVDIKPWQAPILNLVV